MAEGGSDNGNIDKISKRLSYVHLDLMDEEDNYVQHFVPAAPTHPQLTGTVALQAGALASHQNVAVLPQAAGALATPSLQQQQQNIQQPIQPMAPQQPHENLFQQAILEHAASVGSRPQTVQATPVNQPTFQQSRFVALHTLSSSDSSTASTSSSSSGDSANSVTGTNMPPWATFQSMGPHSNIPFDLLVNQFWSDPSFVSSYYEATFHPRAALPHEVTLLIPNIFNMGETVPVNILKTDLMNIYMTIFRHQLTEEDFVEEEDNGQTYSQTTAAAGECKIPAQWQDFMRNIPLLPSTHIPPRHNPGVVQQRALPIPLPTQLPSSQQTTNIAPQMLPAVPPQQQPTVARSPPFQPMPPTNPVGGEVYTMADLHNLAITQEKDQKAHNNFVGSDEATNKVVTMKQHSEETDGHSEEKKKKKSCKVQ